MHSHQHPTSLLLATHLLLQLLLISVTVIHWIMAHMTPQASYYWLPPFFIKSCTILLWELFRVSLWVRVPLETLYERKHPDDKGLSLYWYAIETLAVAGYQ